MIILKEIKEDITSTKQEQNAMKIENKSSSTVKILRVKFGSQ